MNGRALKGHSPREEWSVERKITPAALISFASGLVAAVSLAATLLLRVDRLEERAEALSARVSAVEGVSVGLVRMEERLAGMQLTLEEVRGEVRRLLWSKGEAKPARHTGPAAPFRGPGEGASL